MLTALWVVTLSKGCKMLLVFKKKIIFWYQNWTDHINKKRIKAELFPRGVKTVLFLFDKCQKYNFQKFNSKHSVWWVKPKRIKGHFEWCIKESGKEFHEPPTRRIGLVKEVFQEEKKKKENNKIFILNVIKKVCVYLYMKVSREKLYLFIPSHTFLLLIWFCLKVWVWVWQTDYK